MKRINELKAKKVTLLTLDFLAISLKTGEFYEINDENEPITISKSIQLIPTHRRAKMFKNIFDVVLNGFTVGELQTNPNGGLLDKNHAIFKYSNEILFTNEISNIYWALKKGMKFNFLKFNKIDIAADTEATGKEHKEIKQFLRGDIDFVGNCITTVQFKRAKEIRYVRFGSKMSDKFVRCYYKRQELEQSNKKYISEFWEKNGFSPDNEVWRTELSISNALMNKISMPQFDNVKDGNTFVPFMNESTIDLIQNQNFLKELFICEAGKLCKYVKTKELEQKKRPYLCQNYYLFNFDIAEKIFLFDRIKDKATKFIHKCKIASKFLHELGIETGQKIYNMIADDIAENTDLARWKMKNEDFWTRETMRKKKNPIYKNMLSSFKDTIYIRYASGI